LYLILYQVGQVYSSNIEVKKLTKPTAVSYLVSKFEKEKKAKTSKKSLPVINQSKVLIQSKSEKLVKSKSFVKNAPVFDLKKKINVCECSTKMELKRDMLKNSSELFFILNDMFDISIPNMITPTPKNSDQYSPMKNPLVYFIYQDQLM
jgi:hypothetical protein